VPKGVASTRLRFLAERDGDGDETNPLVASCSAVPRAPDGATLPPSKPRYLQAKASAKLRGGCVALASALEKDPCPYLSITPTGFLQRLRVETTEPIRISGVGKVRCHG